MSAELRFHDADGAHLLALVEYIVVELLDHLAGRELPERAGGRLQVRHKQGLASEAYDLHFTPPPLPRALRTSARLGHSENCFAALSN
eukprot:472887-Prymnesium_polylepis.1